MSRARKPARLWLRPADETRSATFVILDGGKQTSTGFGVGDREAAEGELSRYLASKFEEKPKSKHRSASEVTVAEVIGSYAKVKEGAVKRPKELAARLSSLLEFWGNKTLDDISTTTCKEYADQRSTRNAARRELEDLRAACVMAIADNICRHEVTVTLPPKPRGRVKHLDRDAIAKLLFAAYRKKHTPHRAKTAKKTSVHVARFILIALYTGSRSGRVWQASFVREDGRPFIDLDAGVFYRAWDDESVAKNKQAPPIRLPRRILSHMRRWRRLGAKYAVEYRSKPADPKKAFGKIVDEVFKDEADIVRHTLRHTAATWLMQAGTEMWEAAGYLGMTKETLENTYGHHHPEHQSGVDNAFTSGKAGKKPRQ
jgi:integrase